MAEEKDKLMDHEYDGIQEYDNPLPKWWLWLFYGSIIFAVIYIPYYHFLGIGDLQEEAYEKEMAAALKVRQEQMAQMPTEDAQPAAVELQADDLVAGEQIYQSNCAPCHGRLGEGGIGPNLTDEFWLHGNSTEAIIKVITEGVPTKGMVPWEATLGPQKIRQVTGYIETLQATNPPNAKEAQGEQLGYMSAEMAAATAEAGEVPKAAGDPEAGKQIYMSNCMACHGAQGEGGIGPNLTDNYWMHGNTQADIAEVIINGVPAKGMVAWKNVLNPTKIEDVVAFVMSLHGTNPPNAKEPQGVEYP